MVDRHTEQPAAEPLTAYDVRRMIEALAKPIRNAAKAVKTVSQTGVAMNAGHYVTWDGEAFDDAGWHDTTTNTSRLTVPAGVTRVRVGGIVRLANSTAGSHILTLQKNRATNVAVVNYTAPVAAGISIACLDSCVAGDYYELNIFVNDTAVDINAEGSSFWIEAT